MNEGDRDDLKRAARAIDAVAINVRRVHNGTGLTLPLAEALSLLQRAEALLLEVAQS